MTILLTSFTTWLPHHKSNASDDLLAIIQRQSKYNCHYLRQLPVEIDAASQHTISVIKQIQPSTIICCGMAESRAKLTIESNARHKENCLQSTVSLSDLILCLSDTLVSHDAGNFVCEGLYYQVLNYLQSINLLIPCIFVHVPILTNNNKENIVQDFNSIIRFFELKTKNNQQSTINN